MFPLRKINKKIKAQEMCQVTNDGTETVTLLAYLGDQNIANTELALATSRVSRLAS